MNSRTFLMIESRTKVSKMDKKKETNWVKHEKWCC